MADDFEPYIDAPGVYDIPVEHYHRDPVVGGSLSSSGARKLLPPSCPALYKAWADGKTSDHAEHFDVGRAAHKEVLGAGEPLVVVDATDWRTKAAKAAREKAWADGHTPVLAEQYEQVQAMAAALRAHHVAGPLLDGATGKPEQTLVWHDEATGVTCRALVDWLRHPELSPQFWVVDYKTAASADPDSVSRAIASYGYHKQGAFYSEGVEALGLDAGLGTAFLLIVQMKEPPYLAVTYQLDPEDIGRGHQFNRKARDVYRRCRARDEWPGYADDRVLPISIPTWAAYEHDGAAQRGDFELEGAPL